VGDAAGTRFAAAGAGKQRQELAVMEAQTALPNGIAIQVEGVSKRFGALLAVDNVSFTVKAGEIFGLLGPNGAGKSTLIRMLTTLVPPTSGTAMVAGHDIIRDPNAVRASIGVIPQNMTSDPELTCAENLGIHARLYGITGARRKQRTAELLEAVGLSDRAGALASTLSGGMRRRLEIARGLVHDPQILFLDEPTTGLDPVSRISVWEMITHLRAQQGRTLFLTTHYMDEADRLCDRLAIVDKGRIVALDTPVALKSSVPGASRIELQFEPDLPNGLADLEQLPAVKSVRSLGSATYRISSDRGPASAQELVELARQLKLELKSLSVQSTSLDDVFLHYTGHGLADAVEAVPAGRGKKGGAR
jgi:ABC-2 type transport system ATP-binding protein